MLFGHQLVGVLIIQTSWAVFFLRLQHKQGAGATRKWKDWWVESSRWEVPCFGSRSSVQLAEWQISSMWQVVCLLQFKLLDTDSDAATQAAWDELMNFTLIWHCCTKYMAYSCKIYAWCMRVWVCMWVCVGSPSTPTHMHKCKGKRPKLSWKPSKENRQADSRVPAAWQIGQCGWGRGSHGKIGRKKRRCWASCLSASPTAWQSG